MTETVWLSVAPQKTELTSFYKMEDRAVPAAVREDNAMLHRGGGIWNPTFFHKGRSTTKTVRKSLEISLRSTGFFA